MLLKPSEVLKAAQVESFHNYGLEVYKKLLIASDAPYSTVTGASFTISFRDRSDALRCIAAVRDMINERFPKNDKMDTEFIFLPPAFIRTNVTMVVEINPHLLLFFHEDGPVIPVAYRTNNTTLHGNDTLLNHILTVYTSTSEHYVDLENIGSVLKIQI